MLSQNIVTELFCNTFSSMKGFVQETVPSNEVHSYKQVWNVCFYIYRGSTKLSFVNFVFLFWFLTKPKNFCIVQDFDLDVLKFFLYIRADRSPGIVSGVALHISPTMFL